jgi:GH25 family lysozyme M1 (1,4-beta-N-acetylmuramidase)
MNVKSSLMKTSGRIAQRLLLAALLAMAMGQGGALAQRPLGIDVSDNNPNNITWSSVRGSGVSYAWAKATEGATVTDGTFVGNVSNGKAAGVLMGAYHYAHPNLNSPGTEAAHFWSVASPYILADGKTIMPMLDMEVFSGVVGASSYSDWANQWCNDIVSDANGAGVRVQPLIYVSACNACEFNSSVDVWLSSIADYNGENPQTGTPWSACASCDAWGSGVWNSWQYSDTGSVPGISGHVDLDVFNGNATTLISTFVATDNKFLVNRKGMAPTPDGQGYWIVASDGGVFSFGDATFYGSMGGQHLNAPVVGMTARPQGDGYWLTGSDGGIFTFGNAGFHGSMGGQHLNAPVVGMESTAGGGGYWEAGADGGIYAFGDAPFNGSLPGLNVHVNNVVGIARTPGNGYWLVGSDGGIYSFSANFYGSMGGQHLNAPVVGMAARPQADGYWLVGSDGGLFAFGNAGFHGSLSGIHLSAAIVGIGATPSGNGYWMVGADGAIYSFGDAPYKGGANF